MSRLTGKTKNYSILHPLAVISALYYSLKDTSRTTGTPHYQIYLETVSRITIGMLTKKLTVAWGSAPHLSISKGSGQENKVYCLKEGGATIETGIMMKQGARTDLEGVTASIVSGSTLGELWKDHTTLMIKFGAGIRACYTALSPNLIMKPMKTWDLIDFPMTLPTLEITQALMNTSVILWGESGSGKTCYARAMLPKALFVSHMDDLLKYDQGEHDGIVFDDMSLMHLHREAQIQLLDTEQPRSIHVRYTTATIPAGTKKIFTTNNNNGFIYNVGDAALERRVTKFEIPKWDMTKESEINLPTNWIDVGEEMKW